MRPRTALLLLPPLAVVAACEVVTSFDRSLIPDGSDGGETNDASVDAQSPTDATAVTDGGVPVDAAMPAPCVGGGIFDPTFGDGGFVYLDDAGRSSVAVLQLNGTILAAGGSSAQGLVLVRLTSNGALDGTFGEGGVIYGGGDPALDLAQQSGGRLVVVGVHGLSRFTAAGALDPTFGDGGVVATAFSATHLALASDDRIVVAGTMPNGRIVLSAYAVDGAQDTSFGNGGTIVTIAGCGALGVPGSVTLAARDGGGVVVSSEVPCFDGVEEDLRRLAPNGAQLAAVLGKAPSGRNAVAIDPAGFITLAGAYGLSRVDQTTLVPDAPYNARVNAVLNGGGPAVEGLGIAFDSQGRMLLVGDMIYDPGGPPPQAALWRFMTNGILDNSFGDAGVIQFPNPILQGDLVPPTAVSLNGRDLVIAGLAWSTFAVAKVKVCSEHDQ